MYRYMNALQNYHHSTSSTMMTYDDLVTTAVTETPELTTMMALYSGQYHEVNPGQYHEVNPGQYYETDPGNRSPDFLLSVSVDT